MKKIGTVVYVLFCISCKNTNKESQNFVSADTVQQVQIDSQKEEAKPVSFTADSISVEYCSTEQKIEFLGNTPKQSSFYIIGTAHSYINTEKLQGYMYDNGGLIRKAFEKIHELQGNNNPLPLFTEGLYTNEAMSDVSSLSKVIPPCVIDMGYKFAQGIDVREKSTNIGLHSLNKKFADIFSEYCEIHILNDGSLSGNLKKDLPPEVFLWLRDTWYPKIISPDIALEKSIFAKVNQIGVVICGIRHVARLGLAGKLDWAIAVVNGGKNILESEDQGMMSNRIIVERYVCESVLKLPCLP